MQSLCSKKEMGRVELGGESSSALVAVAAAACDDECK